MLTPIIADSEIGVSRTRNSPNSSYIPCVTPNAPPYGPTSSPRTKTLGSRRISSTIASRMASRYESSLGIEIPHGLLRRGVRGLHRELDCLIDRLRHARLGLLNLRIVE